MLGVVAYESIHLVGYGLAQRLHGFPGAVFLSVLPPTYEELNSTGSSSLGGGHSAYIHELVHHEVLGGQLSSTLVCINCGDVIKPNGVRVHSYLRLSGITKAVRWRCSFLMGMLQNAEARSNPQKYWHPTAISRAWLMLAPLLQETSQASQPYNI